MPEEKLVKHFEFIAYEDHRTKDFFQVYLPEVISVPRSTLYLGKDKDTDKLFRDETISLFTEHYESICRLLGTDRAINFTGITNSVYSYALNKSSLFQRAVIEDNILSEYTPRTNEQLIIATLLDRAFALANAQTSNAVPLSLVLNQLTGKWLMRLLRKSYIELYNLICKQSWHEIYFLSQDEDWRNFIGSINNYIRIIQKSKIHGLDPSIDSYINKLSHSLSLMSLLSLAKSGALNAIKSKLYNYNLFSEAQVLEELSEKYIDYYIVRCSLFDLRRIDFFANRVIEKLKNKEYYSRFDNQQNNYIIFR